MFLLAAGYIQDVYSCTNTGIIIKYLSCCNYSKTYRYMLFQRQHGHTLKYNYLFTQVHDTH